jgi:hypothetical protein
MHFSQDDIFKSAAVAVETLLDPATKFSEEPTDTPFNRAFNTDLTYWAWVKLPEQQYRLRRFNVAMQGIAAMQPDSVVLNGTHRTSLMVVSEHKYSLQVSTGKDWGRMMS